MKEWKTRVDLKIKVWKSEASSSDFMLDSINLLISLDYEIVQINHQM